MTCIYQPGSGKKRAEMQTRLSEGEPIQFGTRFLRGRLDCIVVSQCIFALLQKNSGVE